MFYLRRSESQPRALVFRFRVVTGSRRLKVASSHRRAGGKRKEGEAPSEDRAIPQSNYWTLVSPTPSRYAHIRNPTPVALMVGGVDGKMICSVKFCCGAMYLA